MSAAGAWRRVGVVLVTRDSAAVVGGALASVAQAAEIVVVDNASSDATCDLVGHASPQAKVLGNSTNEGFGCGCNRGVEALNTEFALILNPDAVLRPGAAEALVAAADRYPKAALLAPVIRRPDGEIEPSHDLDLFGRIASPKRFDPTPEGDVSASFLSGAAFLARREAFRAVGGFDPAIFLYFEDDDLCWRLRAAGWELVRVASAEASHIGGASSAPAPALLRLKARHMGWSRLYFEAKHRSRAAAEASARALLRRHTWRAIGHLFTGRADKRARHAAMREGMLAFLAGRDAFDLRGD
ncbi:MAG: glycosyltransferase family 2 protein [Alphaproteobacteria bacterium]|nr:glycosyltransferase family 2 protein [Alphaproteobacteria bacterium]